MRQLKVAVAIGFAAALSPGAADAQVAYNAPGRGSGYGGGFIELLMTGREPGRPLTAQPSALYAPPAAAFAGPSGARLYAGLPGEPDLDSIERAPRADYRRQVVSYDGAEAVGTIIVDTPSKFLYLIQPGGRALRYGIGVGRPGFTWSGMKTVTMKREWPDWTPPPEMLRRRPDLPRRMEGGPGNPLGARALYLGSSLYRIHGTNEPGTIGQNVSSGCIRMMNDDVADLYERVRVGSRVKVI